MCSILGLVSEFRDVTYFNHLNKRMKHRGPDGNGVKCYSFQNSNLFFGHNRLAIQDLSESANQPMENEKFAMVFNGEIYNHFELRQKLTNTRFKTHSDTETLLCLFEEFGVDKTLSLINGMFAIGLYDKKSQLLYLIRDRVGIKPLYYLHNSKEFAFSSEIKGFPEQYLDRIEPFSVIQTVCLGYTTDKSTYYHSISTLEPGHYLTFNGLQTETTKYWEVSNLHYDDSFTAAVQNTKNLLKQSVNYRLLADVDVGCFLSGGIDSSLMASVMTEQHGKQIKTFTIGFEQPGYDESQSARIISEKIGSEHQELLFKVDNLKELITDFDHYFDEPFGDPAALPGMILSKLTRSKVSVALSGDGGDELFLGYDRYFLTTRYQPIFKKCPQLIRNIISYFCQISGVDKAEKLAYPIKHPELQNWYSLLMTAIKPWELNKVFSKEFLSSCFPDGRSDFLDIINCQNHLLTDIDSLSSLDFKRYLPDNILTKVDRCSMKHSLEARVPFLDHNIVQYAYGLSPNVKLKNGPKSILKEILWEYLPKSFFQGQKRGFSVPLKEWFRGDLHELLIEKIYNLDNRFNQKELLKLVYLHVNHNKNFSYLFWNLLRVK